MHDKQLTNNIPAFASWESADADLPVAEADSDTVGAVACGTEAGGFNSSLTISLTELRKEVITLSPLSLFRGAEDMPFS